jgi:actin-like ATPase involved in cell morphogenesis
MSKHRVVAAIDFGTHGSGFAWAVVSEVNRDITQRDVYYFDHWDRQSLAYPKNLSALLVDSAGDLVDWGYSAERRYFDGGVPKGGQYHEGYKMSLQQNVGSAGTLAGSSGRSDPLSRDEATQLATLCIRQVYEKAIEHITGTGIYTPDDVRWCVTIPAIWDQYTRNLMFKAAAQAGLPDDPDRLLLVPEPEAAALYCIVKGESVLLTSGRRFMVIDAGGGTVDISSYEVSSDRKLAQLGTPNGDKAGSNYLNKYFVDNVLCDRLGVGFVGSLKREHPGDLYQLIRAWEDAKRGVRAEDTREVNIRLTAELYLYVKQNEAAHRLLQERQNGKDTAIKIPASEVRDLFENVTERIIGRVSEQLERMRETPGRTGGEVAILVGGFGESPYLQSRLTEHLEPEGVQLHIPPAPSRAVVTGATHFAYDPSIIRDTRSPLTYVKSVMRPFREKIDPPEKRELNDKGEPYCRDRVEIFVLHGEAVEVDSYRSSISVPLRNDYKDVWLRFFATRSIDPEYVTDPGMDLIAELTVSLAGSMHLPREQREVEVRMYFGETRVRAVARNKETGKEQEVEIRWEPTW